MFVRVLAAVIVADATDRRRRQTQQRLFVGTCRGQAVRQQRHPVAS
jgi:hypothetical protein